MLMITNTNAGTKLANGGASIVVNADGSITQAPVGLLTLGKVYYAALNGLAAALATAGSNGHVVVADAQAVTTATTVPSGVTLEIEQGGLLTFSGAGALAVSGVLMAGPYRIFSGGTVTLGAGACTEVFGEWWGAVGDNATNDTAAFAAALAALPASGGVIRLLARSYAANIGPVNQDNVTLRGTSLFGSDIVAARIVPWDVTKPAVQVANDSKPVRHFALEHLALYGVGPNGVGQIGLDVQGGAYECFYDQHSITAFSQHLLRVQSGTNPTSLQFISRFKYDCGTQPCVAAVKLAWPTGSGWHTASFFSDGHVNGPQTNYDTGTASGGSTSTLVDSAKAWTVNAYAGAIVKVTGGTGSGQYGYVASNTATTLTLQGTWTTAPDATSVFSIFQGYTLDNDGVEVALHNVYMDMTDGHGVRFQKSYAGATTALMRTSGAVSFDAGGGLIIVVGPGGQSGNLPSVFGAGALYNGSFLALDGTLCPQTIGTNPRIFSPQVFGTVQWQDAKGALVSNLGISWSGTNFQFQSAGQFLFTMPATKAAIFSSDANDLVVWGGFGPQLRAFTTATRPAASTGKNGTLIYVSDGAAGSNVQCCVAGAWVGIG